MNLLKKLAGLLAPAASHNPEYRVEVQCDRCGEVIRARVDLHNDLSIEYGQQGEVTYFCRKGLMGNQRCYQIIEVELSFDSQRRLLNREVHHGKFVETKTSP